MHKEASSDHQTSGDLLFGMPCGCDRLFLYVELSYIEPQS